MNDELYEKLVEMKKEIIRKQENDNREVDLYSEAEHAYDTAFDNGYWSGQLHIINIVLGEIV